MAEVAGHGQLKGPALLAFIQPRVLEGDHCVIGEDIQAVLVGGSEGPVADPVGYAQHALDLFAEPERHVKESTDQVSGLHFQLQPVLRAGHAERLSGLDDLPDQAVLHPQAQPPGVLLAHALGSAQVQLSRLLIDEEEDPFVCTAQEHRGLYKPREKGLQVHEPGHGLRDLVDHGEIAHSLLQLLIGLHELLREELLLIAQAVFSHGALYRLQHLLGLEGLDDVVLDAQAKGLHGDLL